MKISRQAVSSTETQDVIVYIFLPPASYPWKHLWKQTVNQPYTHNANAFNQEDMEGDNQTSILSEKTLKNQKRAIYVFIEVFLNTYTVLLTLV